MATLNEIIAEYNEAHKKIQAIVKDKLTEEFGQFFKDNPEFRSIEWNQYTPYFNDGEECNFRVSDIIFTLQPSFYDEDMAETILENDYSVYDLEPSYSPIAEPSDYMRSSSYFKDRAAAYDALSEEVKENYSRLWNVWEKFHETLSAIPEEFYLDIFDDHVSVKVMADGIEVSQYDHE